MKTAYRNTKRRTRTGRAGRGGSGYPRAAGKKHAGRGPGFGSAARHGRHNASVGSAGYGGMEPGAHRAAGRAFYPGLDEGALEAVLSALPALLGIPGTPEEGTAASFTKIPGMRAGRLPVIVVRETFPGREGAVEESENAEDTGAIRQGVDGGGGSPKGPAAKAAAPGVAAEGQSTGDGNSFGTVDQAIAMINGMYSDMRCMKGLLYGAKMLAALEEHGSMARADADSTLGSYCRIADWIIEKWRRERGSLPRT